MTVSSSNSDGRTALPARWVAVAAAAGLVSLFGTFWDDAWHTDRGRDDAWIAPHLVLYGGVAIAGLVVVGWGLAAFSRVRSAPALLTEPSLLLAGAGGATTLTAAPIDAMWHGAFGRDAVLWSPPHLLALAGSATLIIGVASGAARTRNRAVEIAVSILLLGSLLVPVLEYETDVPQFSEVWYLPVLLTGGLMTAAVIRSLMPGRRAVAPAVLGYAAVRMAITGGLALLGFSTPDLPIAVLGLIVVDLPWRGWAIRYAASAAAISALAWLAAGAGLASQQGTAVVVVAVPIIAAFVLSALLGMRRGWLGAVAGGLLAAGAVFTALPPSPAYAHDPGQGVSVAAVTLTATSDGTGRLTVAADLDARCRAEPQALVARRAGSTIRTTLVRAGECGADGTVQVPDPGRWFVYVELRDGDRDLEAWVPVEAGRQETVTVSRELYRPAGGVGLSRAEIVAGAGLYAVLGLLLAVTLWQVRRVAPAGSAT